MIEEWWHSVIDQEKGEPPADVLILQDINSNIAILYERHHSFCYNNDIKDYVVKFLPSYQFLVVHSYLRRKYGTRNSTSKDNKNPIKHVRGDNRVHSV
jgi:hypothetical protein